MTGPHPAYRADCADCLAEQNEQDARPCLWHGVTREWLVERVRSCEATLVELAPDRSADPYVARHVCTCGSTPATYDGPHEDCEVHGEDRHVLVRERDRFRDETHYLTGVLEEARAARLERSQRADELRLLLLREQARAGDLDRALAREMEALHTVMAERDAALRVGDQDRERLAVALRMAECPPEEDTGQIVPPGQKLPHAMVLDCCNGHHSWTDSGRGPCRVCRDVPPLVLPELPGPGRYAEVPDGWPSSPDLSGFGEPVEPLWKRAGDLDAMTVRPLTHGWPGAVHAGPMEGCPECQAAADPVATQPAEPDHRQVQVLQDYGPCPQTSLHAPHQLTGQTWNPLTRAERVVAWCVGQIPHPDTLVLSPPDCPPSLADLPAEVAARGKDLAAARRGVPQATRPRRRPSWLWPLR